MRVPSGVVQFDLSPADHIPLLYYRNIIGIISRENFDVIFRRSYDSTTDVQTTFGRKDKKSFVDLVAGIVHEVLVP